MDTFDVESAIKQYRYTAYDLIRDTYANKSTDNATAIILSLTPSLAVSSVSSTLAAAASLSAAAVQK